MNINNSNLIEYQKDTLEVNDEFRQIYITRNKITGFYKLYYQNQLLLTAQKTPLKTNIYMNKELIAYIKYNSTKKKYVIYRKIQLNDIYMDYSKDLIDGILEIFSNYKPPNIFLYLPANPSFSLEINDYNVYFKEKPYYRDNTFRQNFICKEIKIPSIKNIQIIDFSYSGVKNPIFEFGKMNKNKFVSIFKKPLSLLQAFSISLILFNL